MELSLMFFSSGEQEQPGGKYKPVLQAAKFADANGFKRIWIPERHFIPFGALYPNPAVLASAIACQTQNIRLAAGSLVSPLHNPLRLAEEWAMVDNLSGGRVDVSFACGWHPDDFALAPENYKNRHMLMRDSIDNVKKLWQSDTLKKISGNGNNINVRTYPTPIQEMLPIWITAARNAETFRYAGENNYNILTYLVDMGMDGLENAINLYREGRLSAGLDPLGGEITVMLHTLICKEEEQAWEKCRAAYVTYLTRNKSLLADAATALNKKVDAVMIDAQAEELITHQFNRIFENLSLMGTHRSCARVVNKLEKIGITEIACLVDFIEDQGDFKACLHELNRFKAELKNTSADKDGHFLFDRPDLVHRVNGETFNQFINTDDVLYGEYMQFIREIHFNDKEVVSRIHAPDDADDAAILDNCLITMLGHLLITDHIIERNIPSMPLGFESMDFLAPLSRCLYSHAIIEPSAKADELKGNIVVYNDAGEKALVIKGMKYKIRKKPIAPLNRLIHLTHDIVWKAAPVSTQQQIAGRKNIVVISTNAALLKLTHVNGDDSVITLLLENTLLSEPPAIAKMLRQLWRDKCTNLGNDFTVVLDASAHENMYEAFEESAVVLLGLCHAIIDVQKPGDHIELLIATAGAQVVIDQEAVSVATTGIWAMGRTIGKEMPGIDVKLLDINFEDEFQWSKDLFNALKTELPAEAAIRNNKLYTPVMQSPASVMTRAIQKDFKARNDKAYFITGATGGIGQVLIAWLISNGARHIILLHRGMRSVKKANYQTTGIHFYEIIADINDEASVENQLQQLRTDGLPLIDGVFHLAGITNDQSFLKITRKSMKETVAPKYGGTGLLYKLTNGDNPSAFVVFSSIAAVIASVGQAAYAAANAMTNAFVHNLSRHSTIVKSISWGPWLMGMVSDSGLMDKLAEIRLNILNTDAALKLLDTFITTNGNNLIISDFKQASKPQTVTPFSKPLAQGARADKLSKTLAQTFIRQIKDKTTFEEKVMVVENNIRDIIKYVLENDYQEIESSDDLNAAGIDSLVAMQVRSEFSERFNLNIPITTFLEIKTLNALAQEILPLLLLIPESPGIKEPSVNKNIVTVEI